VAVRDRLRQHLDRANGIGEVITVERELARVQGEIEVLTARLKQLRGSVAFAELTISARHPVELGPVSLVLVTLTRWVGKLFVWST
jgi:hypothetical protein